MSYAIEHPIRQEPAHLGYDASRDVGGVTGARPTCGHRLDCHARAVALLAQPGQPLSQRVDTFAVTVIRRECVECLRS
ncbi:hypothetical protein [Kribbella sp. NBC_00889]|uniref:hypothetical protein n=1 Tax=Kribbella sp. NBC_00889 TaxID=2975974 RepID=UPI003864357A|nr:hypothetical protein OG817_12680 [Kribbella sp. NBC_00889]